MFEIRELHDENFFVNLVVQKDDLNVYLLDFSIVNDDYDIHCFVIHWFYHWNERFRMIQFFDLLEIANHSSCLLTQNFVVFFSFDFINSFVSKYSSILKKLINVQISLIKRKLFSFFIIFNHSFRLKSFIVFLYDRSFAIYWKSITFFMHIIINKFNEFEKSKRWRNSKWRFKTLRIENIDEIDSMLSVLTFVVEKIKKNETTTID